MLIVIYSFINLLLYCYMNAKCILGCATLENPLTLSLILQNFHFIRIGRQYKNLLMTAYKIFVTLKLSLLELPEIVLILLTHPV